MAIGNAEKLTSLYNFEDGLDLGADVSGKGNDGTAINVTQATIGGQTNVAEFNGTSSRIDLSSAISGIAGASQFYVAFRFRLRDLTGTRALFKCGDSAVTDTDWTVFWNGTDLRFQFRNGGVNFWQFDSSVTPLVDTWYHCVATSGPNGAELFLDGVSVGSDPSTASLVDVTVNSADIGAYVASGSPTFWLDGYVKDFVMSDQQANVTMAADMDTNDILSYSLVSLLGQSNEIGRAPIRVGIDDDYTKILNLVYQWGFDAQSKSAATNPLDHQDENPGEMGHWLELCDNLVDLLGYKQGILLVPAARGGTGFDSNDWNPGDTVYEAALSSVNAATTAFTNASAEYTHWLQGENDADSGNLNYQADLTAMYNDYNSRSEFTATTPFVVTTILGSLVPANVPVINAALLSFSQTSPDIYYVDATDLTLFDTYHYDAPSQVTIGQRSYNAVFGSATLNISISGAMPDDTYRTVLYLENFDVEDATNQVYLDAPIAYVSGAASVPFGNTAGLDVIGTIYNNDNPPQEAATVVGVTE